MKIGLKSHALGSQTTEPGVVESVDEGIEFFTIEVPVKGFCRLHVVILEGQQTVLDFGKRTKVVRLEDFSLRALSPHAWPRFQSESHLLTFLSMVAR